MFPNVVIFMPVVFRSEFVQTRATPLLHSSGRMISVQFGGIVESGVGTVVGAKVGTGEDAISNKLVV